MSGKVIFGGYDIEKYGKLGTTEDDIVWLSLTNKTDYFWTVNMDQARLYGGNPLNHKRIYSKVELQSRYLMIDTGLSYALAPYKDIKIIVDSFHKYYGVQCTPDNSTNLSFMLCDLKEKHYSELPNI